ncbi:tetratricopeptide-like helical domain-containing protein [Artemisia annua]|uniref:Tetratricopeptide-like helical domain-containing protein n=1 Tax=Artemisia annua TaxID=35608 RepID=A0A2U1NWU7_ARTAN|nr:tetratricopeptide-like helical domain-containing protein [Artemisia annua]
MTESGVKTIIGSIGKSGETDKAKKLVKKKPLEPDDGVWGSLLAACGLHSCYEIANGLENPRTDFGDGGYKCIGVITSYTHAGLLKQSFGFFLLTCHLLLVQEYGGLSAACRVHKNLETAKLAGDNMCPTWRRHVKQKFEVRLLMSSHMTCVNIFANQMELSDIKE